MTTTPPNAPIDEGPRVSKDEVRDLGRLRRSRSDKKVAGVAAGIARHLDIDPVIIRVAFVVLAVFGGVGLIVYGACWLLIPEDGADSATIHLDDRSRGVALIIVGVIALAALVGGQHSGWFSWPVLAIGLALLWFATRRDHDQAPQGPAGPPTVAPGRLTDEAGPSGEAGEYPASSLTLRYGDHSDEYSGDHGGDHGGGTYVAPPAAAYVRPPNPRRRGPVLFWFTLALIVLSLGVLGMVDLAGVDVTPSAYPALAMAISGVMLVVGAFFGRAGGIILLGLVAALATAGASAADRWDTQQVTERPATASAVHAAYSIDAGELVVDLRNVSDLDNLDGRTIRVSADVGHVEVRVPAGLTVVTHASVDGPGDIDAFGRNAGGIDTTLDVREEAGAGAPVLTVDAQVDVGQITVTD